MLSKFHFDITKILCEFSGYSKEDSFKIAYADCITDYNTINYEVNGYRNKRSQTYDIIDKERSDIYFCFHYIPGNNEKPAGRKDSKENKYSVIADSKLANMILDEALRTKDLNRIGIALHAYQDTFSHQGFSGMWDNWNSVWGLGSIVGIVPNIGHAEAFDYPDTNRYWYDHRYEDHVIHNSKRWIKCCLRILKKLADADMDYYDTDIDSLLAIIFNNNPSEFNNKWDTEDKIKADFQNWKAFMDAVKEHKNYCLQLFKEKGL